MGVIEAGPLTDQEGEGRAGLFSGALSAFSPIECLLWWLHITREGCRPSLRTSGSGFTCQDPRTDL